jgi:hypothetical protein
MNFSSLGLTLKLLWTLHFYKVNWVSTGLEWGAIVWMSILLVCERRRLAVPVAFLLLIPLLGAAHCLVFHNFAPRAIHGAMVLKVALTGLLLAEVLVLQKENQRDRMKWWIPLSLMICAYMGHHALIANWRGQNSRVLEAKFEAIEQEIRTCQEPCVIHAENLSDLPKWDWMMVPGYHEVVVQWLALRNHIHKKFQIMN